MTVSNVSTGSTQVRITGLVECLLAKRLAGRPVRVSGDLHEAGLTSLDLVNLMLGVESEFDIEIPEAEMTPDNFRTIGAIETLVRTLAQAS